MTNRQIQLTPEQILAINKAVFLLQQETPNPVHSKKCVEQLKQIQTTLFTK